MKYHSLSACTALLLVLLSACSVAQNGQQDEDARALEPTVSAVRAAASPITGSQQDYDPLLEMIGDASFVLLGESTHGTHEFYRERARITRRLIQEKGFSAVVIEGGWPDAMRVNRYIRALSNDASPEHALANFTDFPVWMWRNTEVRDLVRWLRMYNDGQGQERKVGFYGFDVYSVYESIDAVLEGLETMDAATAIEARQRYRCFEGYGSDPQRYGHEVSRNPAASCEEQARAQFNAVETLMRARLASDPSSAEDIFSLYQNARVVMNGEAYFRTLYQGGVSSWNLRDQHMAETLEALADLLTASGRSRKVVVWAHNTHIGDARMTQMGEGGEWNVGQLIRQRHEEATVLVGFTTYRGAVTAANEWGETGQTRSLRPALAGSFSAIFHEAGVGNFMLLFRPNEALRGLLSEPRLERAVGVVYRPQTERASHYFRARLGEQFDAVIHIEESTAVEALR